MIVMAIVEAEPVYLVQHSVFELIRASQAYVYTFEVAGGGGETQMSSTIIGVPGLNMFHTI